MAYYGKISTGHVALSQGDVEEILEKVSSYLQETPRPAGFPKKAPPKGITQMFNVLRSCEKCGHWFNQKVNHRPPDVGLYDQRGEMYDEPDDFLKRAREVCCPECCGLKKVKQRTPPAKKTKKPTAKRKRSNG